MNDKIESLTRQASKLTIEDRRELIMMIEKSIGDDITRLSIEGKYALFLTAAEATIGHKMVHGRRKREDVLVRQFVAYRLRQDGYSYPIIGKIMNMNHTTIITLCNKMDDYFSLPNMYFDEIEKYNTFEKLIESHSENL